jgi:hypothetical protein
VPLSEAGTNYPSGELLVISEVPVANLYFPV